MTGKFTTNFVWYCFRGGSQYQANTEVCHDHHNDHNIVVARGDEHNATQKNRNKTEQVEAHFSYDLSIVNQTHLVDDNGGANNDDNA